jgi:uncharacterized protein with LGFP repeats
VTTLDEAVSPPGLAGLVHRIAGRWRPGRRELLTGVAVAGSALVTDPKAYALRPQTAYATICGPASTASGGYTVFCCTITKGVNACPPGSFTAGWWKAADSSWCGGGYRYIVDCNARCTGCTTGCSDGICDRGCWSCSCGSGSTATCDQRRVCCNAFRYGQCNTAVKCSGGVHCRVVSCVAPYTWASCSTTSLSDDGTAEHSAPCLPAWGPISSRYKAMGEQRSYLGASTGPVRSVGDGVGQYVAYQNGSIYWNSRNGAVSIRSFVRQMWQGNGGVDGLGYPAAEEEKGLRDGGWVQRFSKGAITDSASTTTQVVTGSRYTAWVREGRERGGLGYPTAAVTGTSGGFLQRFQGGAVTGSSTTAAVGVWGPRWDLWVREGRETGALRYPTGPRTTLQDGWIQFFQNGAVVDSDTTSACTVWGVRWQQWRDSGRETGPLGYPTGFYTPVLGVGSIQTFQNGAVTGSRSTPVVRVVGTFWDAWRRAGREGGVLGFPTGGQASVSRGARQPFQGGGLWALSGKPAYRVTGAVLSAWEAAGGAGGRYGFPLTDTTTSGGVSTCRFEGGTITA